jgi:hypothetical protein
MTGSVSDISETAKYTRSMDMRHIYWAVLAPFGFVIFTLGLLSVGAG